MLPSVPVSGAPLPKTAVIAANRFGFGARPQDVAAIGPDPQGWLRRQVPPPGQTAPLPAALQGLPRAEDYAARFFAARQAMKQGDAGAAQAAREMLQPAVREEAAALFRAQAESDTPFVERWVQFWANHFTVAGRQQIVAAMAGAYEREAIRPHAFGRFGDMLLAATRHPAMLLYLDNAASIGPNSRAGQRRHVGLNENHGRELLELHTVSPAAGYTQADVIALAKMLTGWSLGRAATDDCTTGAFCFRPAIHEPGPQVLLGHVFEQRGGAQNGVTQGEAALAMLAAHPATARHIAEKLARQFIADDPPPDAVAALAQTFRDSDGDLRTMALAVIARPEAWQPQNRKLRTPRDFLVAAARLTGLEMQPQRLMALLRQFGQPAFMPPSPAGWPDRANDWMAPDALRQRIELAYIAGQKLRPPEEPAELLDVALGASAGSDTRQAVARAESRQAAVATVLAAPEFQWR